MNHERKELQAGVAAAALGQAKSFSPGARALVLAGEDWHEGVIGIVASKVVELHYKPTVMVTFHTHNGLGKGSVRAAGRVDVLEALEVCGDLLMGFGGHKAAAGLTIRRECLEEFRSRFNEAVERQVQERLGGSLTRELHVDAEVSDARELVAPAVRAMDRLSPFGIGNAEPVIAWRGSWVKSHRTMKEKHLKLSFKGSAHDEVEGVWFNAAGALDGILGVPVDVAFVPQINTYRNAQAVQLKVRDARANPVQTA
ncbi:MAG: hypothetical protein HUU37_10450 [Bdellovibrionales bacterium]|nr:hypothetical protein [Bdellovibrionales bacterium]